MTGDLFNKACELNEKIKKYKKIIKSMNSPYVNIIRFNDFGNDSRDISQVVTLSNEPELEQYIKEYFFNKLSILEKEFEELK